MPGSVRSAEVESADVGGVGFDSSGDGGAGWIDEWLELTCCDGVRESVGRSYTGDPG